MSGFFKLWQEATLLDHQRIQGKAAVRPPRPADRKEYPGRPRLDLPPPSELDVGTFDVWEALHRRRSMRAFLPDPLPLKKLSALLWACQGVTAKSGRYLFKTAPSAGAAYPYETYVFAHRVEGLAPGFYHFDPAEFCLTLVREADLSRELAAACLDQRFTAEAPAVVAWSAIPARSAWKYGDRAARYVGLDLGHVCENLFLGAVALGLGACAVGAFLDADLNRLMELDGEEEFAFYLAAVGTPRD